MGESVAIPEPVVEQPKVEPIGPTIRSILDKIGVKIDENNLNDAQKCLASLPFPYSFLFKKYLDEVLANPIALQTIVKQVSEMFPVDEKTLFDEVNVAIDFIKNPPAPEPLPKQPEPEIPSPKVEKAAPQSMAGPILTEIFRRHFGINESCFSSQEQLFLVVKNTPFFRALWCMAGKPEVVNSLATSLAHRFSVDHEQVTGELQQLAELVRSFQPQVPAAAEQQNAPVPGCRRGFRQFGRCNRWQTADNQEKFHPATCDNCKSLISGIRFYCLHCRNFDLCSTCEQKNTDSPFHDESHIFAKIRDPATPYRIDNLIRSPNGDAPIPPLHHLHRPAHRHPHHPFPHPPHPAHPHPFGINNANPESVNPAHPPHHPRHPASFSPFPFPFPHCNPPLYPDPRPSDEEVNVDSPPYQRALPHLPPLFRHRFPGSFPPAPPAQATEEDASEEPQMPHWWYKRLQHRAEAKNRLDQLEASVKQLKETISQLQNGN